MSQCVPSWALDEPPSSPKLSLGLDTMLDYEVAELTCENGHIVMHGLGPPRTVGQLPTAAGTLESIVDQATTKQTSPAPQAGDMLVPWFDSASATVTLDEMVPGASAADRNSTRMFSCKSPPKARVDGAAAAAREGSSRNNHSVNGEEIEVDTCGFTSTSDNTDTNAATVDERDSVSHSRTQEKEKGKGKMEEEKGNNGKSSVSTKRSRAAAIHNQSERKRRDKINQKMKTLQKLVPNSSKTDKASMLDEVIDYLKQLQAQVQIMSRMGMPNMMMNMTMQQQLQMSMMAQMGLGMGMAGMGMMDMNTMARAGSLTGIPPAVLNPAAFMPYLASWDGAPGDRGLPSVPRTALPPDPFSTFLASQQQPMTMDNYSRMAALYQQLHQLQQQSGPGAKN